MIDDQQAVSPPTVSVIQTDCQLDALIERWWSDHFPGSAVARYTAAWNAAHSAKEALKRLLGRHQRGSQATVDVEYNDLQGSI